RELCPPVRNDLDKSSAGYGIGEPRLCFEHVAARAIFGGNYPRMKRIHFMLILATLAAFGASGQTVRVTTWDMTTALAGEKSSTTAIEKTAEQLKKISPDVVFVRGVSGWKMCSQLADALKPAEYHVAVCSAFRVPGTSKAAPYQ